MHKMEKYSRDRSLRGKLGSYVYEVNPWLWHIGSRTLLLGKQAQDRLAVKQAQDRTAQQREILA